MTLKNFNPDDNYQKKIHEFIFEYEKNKKNLSILEFGVREGRSTKMFLNICSKNEGKLISVDIDDYSTLFDDKNWTFLQTRDDNYEKVSKLFSDKFDIILVDSFHEPNHVAKLIYLYWKHLKLNGSLYVDDISWLPYVKGSWRDHKFTENINRDTFNKLLEIQLTNFENINLAFSFNGSGMSRLIKLSENELNKSGIINLRNSYIKKLFKKFKNLFKHY